MKTVISFFIAIFFLTKAFAQISKEERIQDSVIGWDPANYYDRNYKLQTSPAGKQKETYLNKFAEWVKKSYTPVAGLGEYQRIINTNNYFDVFHVWDVAFDHLDAQKRFKPIGETGYPRFWIGANFLSGVWTLDFMNRNDWFFTMQPDGVVAQTKIESEEKMKARDARIAPNAYPYLTWINDMETVYLVPGNKLPMRLATKGEFLKRALERMDYVQDSLTKEDLQKEWRKDEATQSSIRKNRKDEVDRCRNVIKSHLDKYKNQLNEPAYINQYQARWNSFDPYADDMFTVAKNSFLYPVYIIDSATIQKMKESKPLWIAITFQHSKSTDGNKYQEAYKSLTQNLNYDYIYNYFFDPEKVEDKPYVPANEEQLNARLAVYKNKNDHNRTVISSDKNLPAGVLYKEDFSANAENAEPADWYYYKAGAEPYKVTTLPNEKGKWLKMGYGRSIRPSTIKTPLPKDFKLEYDVATDGNYDSRTGGAVMLTITSNKIAANNDVGGAVAGKSATIKVVVEAGNEADFNNNNYRGILRVDVSNVPEQNTENYSGGIRAETQLRSFTEKKTKVHITVQVQNGAITVSANGIAIIKPADFKMTYGGKCNLCGVPPGLQFTALLWNNVTNDAKNMNVYISNIMVSAL